MAVITPINETTWAMALGRDLAILGNIDAPNLLAHLAVGRWHGNSQYVLSYPGSPSGLAMVDVPNGVIRVPYGDVSVELTAHDPTDDAPDGRAEFNVILNAKPEPDANGEYWQAVDFQAEGLTFQRILGLDEEYDQARCAETWDHDPGPFTITPTEIRDADGQLLMRRPEHQVHSIVGRADRNNHHKSALGKNRKNGQDITYTRVSRDHLRLPRRLLVDDRGKTARIEDVVFDGQLKFKLPAQFIKTAKYPVRHATGLDPAYTEDMDYWESTGTDATWTDYDLYTNKGVPKGAVAEIIMENVEAGVESSLGIRTDGSSVSRLADIHEAEGGGYTHLRTFVTCHATTGYVETYAEDVSDLCRFHLVGYWENVTWVEESSVSSHTVSVNDTWETWTLPEGADRLHQVIMRRDFEEANTCGVRAYGSSLERKIMAHEAEAGGNTCLDLLVKADSSKRVEIWDDSCTYATKFTSWGYFGEEMDFVEWWQTLSGSATGQSWSYYTLNTLDEGGRHVDALCLNSDIGAEVERGIRVYGSSVDRMLVEHEAEGVGGYGSEFTGFGMSAGTDASKRIGYRYHKVTAFTETVYVFTGYYKPAAGAATVQFCNDTVGLAEGLVRGAIRSRRFCNDTEGISDVPVRRARAVRLVPDTVGIVEGLLRHNRFVKLIGETVTVAEGLVRTASLVLLVNEAVAVAEALARRARSVRVINNTVGVIEALLRRGRGVRVTDETVGVTEAVSRRSRAIRFATETISVSEGVVRKATATLVKIIDETLAVGEALVKRGWGVYVINETEGVTEAISRRARAVRLVNETVSILEGIVTAMPGKMVRFINETIALTDSQIRRARGVRVISETVGVLDAISRRARATRFATETLAVAEGIVRRSRAVRLAADTVAVAESVVRRSRAARFIAETVAVGEGLVRRARSVRLIGEAVAITETVVFWPPMTMVLIINETVAIAEGVVRRWLRILDLVEGAIHALFNLKEGGETDKLDLSTGTFAADLSLAEGGSQPDLSLSEGAFEPNLDLSEGDFEEGA